jgi:hypothetical protein
MAKEGTLEVQSTLYSAGLLSGALAASLLDPNEFPPSLCYLSALVSGQKLVRVWYAVSPHAECCA